MNNCRWKKIESNWCAKEEGNVTTLLLSCPHRLSLFALVTSCSTVRSPKVSRDTGLNYKCLAYPRTRTMDWVISISLPIHSYKVYKEKTFWSYHLWTNYFILHFISHYAAPGPPEKLTCKITDNYNVHVKWDPPEDNLFLYPVLCYILQSSSGKIEGGKICNLSSLLEWILVEKETFRALVLC